MNIPKMAGDGPMRASAWNALVDTVRKQRILPSVNILATETAYGTSLVAKATPSNLRPSVERYPWDLLVEPDPESESEDPPLLVKLIPGAINGIVPSNWSDEFTINDDDVKYGVAKIGTDGINITSLEWELVASLPQPQTAQLWAIPNTVHYVFGVVHKSATINLAMRSGGYWDYYYGSGFTNALHARAWIAKPRNNPPAGELSYDMYYYLA